VREIFLKRSKKGVDNWGMVWYSNKAVSQEQRMSRTEKEIVKKMKKVLDK